MHPNPKTYCAFAEYRFGPGSAAVWWFEIGTKPTGQFRQLTLPSVPGNKPLACDPRRSRRRDGVVRVSHPSHLLPECGRHLADEVRPAMSNASYTAPAFGWALFLGISTINVAWPKRITPCCCERGSSRRAWSSRKFPMRRPPHRYRGRAKIAVMAKKVAQTSRETPAKISFLPVASIAFATRSAD